MGASSTVSSVQGLVSRAQVGVSFLVVTYMSRAHMGESCQLSSVLWLLAFALVIRLPSRTPPPQLTLAG